MVLLAKDAWAAAATGAVENAEGGEVGRVCRRIFEWRPIMNPDALVDYDNSLKKAVLMYLSEYDNPVPDYNYRRMLRNRLRELTGAPAEPAPRSRT
jgi:hypothetical protein